MIDTVLMTCVGGELAPQMIRQLQTSVRHPGLRVIGVDGNSGAGGRHVADAFHVVPMGDAPGYVDAIVDIVRRHGVGLVIPTSDEEALALSADRGRIEQSGCVLACTDYSTLRMLSDKTATYTRMSELGLPVPDWARVESLDELARCAVRMSELHGDIVVKPAVERGGRNVFIVGAPRGTSDSRVRETVLPLKRFIDDVLPGFGHGIPAIVMPRFVEPVHDLDMLAWRGSAIRLVPRRRVSSALPNEGHVIVDLPALAALGARLIEGFNLSWLYDCDIMFDGDGRPWVLEINPRQSGSVAATIAAGVPLLDDVVSLACGQAVPAIEIAWNSVIVPYKSLAVSRASTSGVR